MDLQGIHAKQNRNKIFRGGSRSDTRMGLIVLPGNLVKVGSVTDTLLRLATCSFGEFNWLPVWVPYIFPLYVCGRASSKLCVHAH